MRRSFRTACLALIAVLVPLVPVSGPTSTTARAAGERYVDLVFPSVTQHAGLVYATEPALVTGTSTPLRLDVYEPTGDTAPARPLIVVIHGGGFRGGNRDTLKDIAIEWTRRGYVTATIDYRLDPGNRCQDIQDGKIPPAQVAAETVRCANAIHTAQWDAHGAIRWLRANASTYRIDTHRVAVLGGSAGAVTAVNVAQRADQAGTTGDDESFDPTVRAALAMSGCNYDPVSIGPGDAPVSIIASEFDQAVPFTCAQDTVDRTRAAGLTAELLPFLGEGTHASSLYRKHQAEIDRSWTRFLIAHLGLDGRALGGSQTTVTGATAGRSAFVSLVVTENDAPGYVQALPCGTTPGGAANLNTDAAGQTRSGLALVTFPATGGLCLFTQSTSHLVADLQAYVDAGAIDDVPDERLVDTRSGTRPGAGSRTVIHGRPGASALVSLSVTDTSGALFVQVLPCDAPAGGTANLNADAAGQIRSGLSIVRFDSTGTACLYTNRATHLVADLQGYLVAGALDDVVDERLLDTRPGAQPSDGAVMEIHGRPGASAFVSLVATETSGALFLQVLACGSTPGSTANLNVDRANATVSGAAIVRFGADGRACVFTNRATDVVVDLQAYFVDGAIDDVADVRLLDTRAS